MEKYRTISQRMIDRHGECLTIVIGTYDGRKAAFLLQNMFPITEEYIDHVHTMNGNPVPVSRAIRNKIEAKRGKLMALLGRGKSLLYTDLRKMETAVTPSIYHPSRIL